MCNSGLLRRVELNSYKQVLYGNSAVLRGYLRPVLTCLKQLWTGMITALFYVGSSGLLRLVQNSYEQVLYDNSAVLRGQFRAVQTCSCKTAVNFVRCGN